MVVVVVGGVGEGEFGGAVEAGKGGGGGGGMVVVVVVVVVDGAGTFERGGLR